MTEAGSIDRVLDLDDHNVRATRAWLRSWDPELYEALHDVSSVFESIMRSAGQGTPPPTQESAVLSAALAAIGTTDEETLDRMLDETDQGDEHHRAALAHIKRPLDLAWARQARKILAAMCHRAYLWSVTDLMRRRFTPSIGSMRVQVEAAGLAAVMLKDPALARLWFKIDNDASGARFHKMTSGRIREALRPHRLERAWNLGSGFGAHARFGTVVDSLSESGLGVHEGSRSGEGELALRFLAFLTTQPSIARLLLAALPEASDPITIHQRVPRLGAKVSRLIARFGEVHPELATSLAAGIAARKIEQ